jgi:hypothetical protein
VQVRSGIALAVFLCGLAAASDATDAAGQLAHAAAKAERKGDTARAYVLYSQAYALDPSNLDYAVRVKSFENMARADTDFRQKSEAIRKEPKPGAGLDESLFGEVTPKDAAEARQPLPPTDLNATPGVRNIDLRGNAESLFEEVAKAYGLLATFDSEFKPTPTIHFELEQADYRTALRALEEATGAFIIPIADRLIFVAADTPAKRQQFERTVTVAIPIPETLSTQDLQEIATAIRSTMDIKQLMVDTTNRILVLRDHVSRVRPAQALAEDLMRPHAQVELEVDLLSVDSSKSLQWGLGLPNSFPMAFLGQITRYISPTAIASGSPNFLAFGGGATLFGIGVASASLFANVTDSLTTTALRSRLIAEQGQAATLNVGSKYPLVTSTFIGAQPGETGVPPPTIQFQDLGLELKVTPYIHGMNEVTLQVEASYTLLGQVDANGIPTINNRKFQSTVRLHEGEWAVLTGLVSRMDASTLGGVYALGSVPGLGPLLSTNTRDKSFTDALIVIKPRLINLPPSEEPGLTLSTGTEARPISLL